MAQVNELHCFLLQCHCWAHFPLFKALLALCLDGNSSGTSEARKRYGILGCLQHELSFKSLRIPITSFPSRIRTCKACTRTYEHRNGRVHLDYQFSISHEHKYLETKLVLCDFFFFPANSHSPLNTSNILKEILSVLQKTTRHSYMPCHWKTEIERAHLKFVLLPQFLQHFNLLNEVHSISQLQ